MVCTELILNFPDRSRPAESRQILLDALEVVKDHPEFRGVVAEAIRLDDTSMTWRMQNWSSYAGHMEDFRKGPLYPKLIASLRGIGVKPSIITHHDFPEAIPSAPYLEYAMITLVDPSPSTISKFDSSVQGFKHFLTESKGFKGWTFAPEYEDPKKVLAVIGWDAKEDFDAFLKSDGHKGWAEGFGKLVGDVVVGAPDVWLAKSVEVATVGLKEAGLA